MTVIPGLLGIEVEVRANSLQITEQSNTIPSGPPNTVAKYISAVPNTEFEVFLHITSEYNFDCPTLGFEIFVDGVRLAAKCCLQSKRGCIKEWAILVQGAEMGELDAGRGEVRPFLFSKMGEIRVEVHRRGHGQRVETDYVPEPEETGFKLGLPRPMKEPVTFWYAPLLDSEPLGVFRFIYRSDEGKESPDTEMKDVIVELGLAEQSKNRSNIAKQIKREHSDDEDIIHPKKKAKLSAAKPDERTKAVFHWNGREIIWSSVPWFDSDDENVPVPVIKRERESSDDENLRRKRARRSKDWDVGLYDGGDGMGYLMDY